MISELQQNALEYGGMVILFGLPVALMILPRRSSWLGITPIRFCLAVFGTSMVVGIYDCVVLRPLAFQRASEEGDMLYDGTGAGAATVILCLIVPAFLATVVLGLQWVLRRLHIIR